MAEAAAPVPPSARTSFLHNVAWGWLGVAVNITIGLLLSPIIIRRLGADRYGLWVLLFATVEYLRMLDFGFRAAIVNAVARCRARHDWEGVNRTLVTGLVYFIVVGVACCVAAIALRGVVLDVLNVPADQLDEARTLIVIIALAVSFRLVLSPLNGTLEGCQRFDLVNRAYISALVFRAVGSIGALLLGYGLVELALVILTAQIGENIWNLISVSRVVPSLRLSPSQVRTETLIALFRFGRHSAVWVIANVVSLQVPTTVLGFLRGPLAVGFFALPLRLLLYSAEALTKVSDVTSSVTAAVDEARNPQKVWRLAILTNRHSLALFMPAAVFLLVYGTPLLAVWINEEFAVTSGPLIPVLLIYFVFAIAGQHNAGAVLLGQGKHAKYAYANVIEVIVSTAGLFLVVPRFGLLGAAWVLTVTTLLIRGVYLAFLICRLNGFRFGDYVRAIYVRPLATAIPVLLVAFALRETLWPGRSWFELIGAGTVISAAYFAIALRSVVEPEHRDRLVRWLVSIRA